MGEPWNERCDQVRGSSGQFACSGQRLCRGGPPAAGASGSEADERADLAAAVTLASLPQMTPMRLRRLLGHVHDPGADHAGSGRSAAGVLDALQRQQLSSVLAPLRCTASEVPKWTKWARIWQDAARHADALQWSGHLARRAISAVRLGHPGYPTALEQDPEAPCLLFLRGARGTPEGLEQLLACRVAIVGTRSATHYGLEVAAELAAALVRVSVTVISGLAVGIDAGAHQGALAAGERDRSLRESDGEDRARRVVPPLGVAGGGVDVVYPRQNAKLWRGVLACGAIIAEAPPGARPEPWRFPLRNRIIAALAEVVVVVESHAAGGSMHTVEAALRRGVPVLAVPGPVNSPASAGTNALLAEGAQVCCGVEDVLTALSLRRAAELPPPLSAHRDRATAPVVRPVTPRDSAKPTTGGSPGELRRASPPWPPRPVTAARPHFGRASDTSVVAGALQPVTTSLEQLLERTSLSIPAATIALEQLCELGQARRVPGGWIAVTGARLQ